MRRAVLFLPIVVPLTLGKNSPGHFRQFVSLAVEAS